MHLIPGQYIVVFKTDLVTASSVASIAADMTAQYGTSMAAPHVTGVVALFLQSFPNATPSTVRTNILGGATGGIVNNPGPGSFNRLLYNPY